jgi:uncharacterized protein (TIGR00255 family)
MPGGDEDGESMIRSMTGYGRTEAVDESGHFTIEIRSLNNRYLDVQVKMPRGLSALDIRVKKTVQERFFRGRFDVSIARNSEHERCGRLVVNDTLAAQYVGILNDLKAQYGLRGDTDLSLIAGLPDLITMTDVKEDPEDLWRLMSKGMSQALDDLDRMRGEEGTLLVRDIRERLETIEHAIQAIGCRMPQTIENARKRMTETLNRLLTELPDQVRLAQEIAVLAERTDVTEELTRLSCHMAQFWALLTGSTRDAVGRKLDFLLQEMGREVNTIASKAMDAQISMEVVNVKAELEKIREQVQNIE